jgi:hypothetical protein
MGTTAIEEGVSVNAVGRRAGGQAAGSAVAWGLRSRAPLMAEGSTGARWYSVAGTGESGLLVQG